MRGFLLALIVLAVPQAPADFVVFNSTTAGGAAVAVLDSASTGNTTGTVVTISFTGSSGTNVAMFVACAHRDTDGGAEISAIEWDTGDDGAGGTGETGFNEIGSVVENFTIRTDAFVLVGYTAGTHNVIITLTEDTRRSNCGVMSYQNVDQGTPTSGAASATGATTTATVDVTSGGSNSIVMDSVGGCCDGTHTVDGSQNEQWNFELGGGSGSCHGSASTETGTGSITMSWTVEGTLWATKGWSIDPA